MLDILRMHYYIMRTNKFPYVAAHYASKIEVDKFNLKIQYDEFLKILPELYIADVDYQPKRKI